MSNTRESFDGLERFSETLFPFIPIPEKEHPQIRKLIEETKKKIEQTREGVKILQGEVWLAIVKALEELDIRVRQQNSPDLRGADLFDTGSSSRGTNIPGSYDFDYMLRLEPKDIPNISVIAANIEKRFEYKENKSYGKGDFYQIRLSGVTGFKDKDGKVIKFQEMGLGVEECDIDIGLTGKNELVVFGSHDAVQEKLEHIQRHYGNEAKNEVIANIVLAKEILKEGKAYKRVEHGGFGGIGVENWILQNNGNIIEAFRSFAEAAYSNTCEQPVSFDEFKQIYKIFNPGINLRYMTHDNYIENMTEQGYMAMAKTSVEFLNKYGISWKCAKNTALN